MNLNPAVLESNWKAPKSFSVEVDLPNNRKVVCLVEHKVTTIDVKLRVLSNEGKPFLTLREPNGKYKTVPLPVKSTVVTCKVYDENGGVQTIVSRSCCKPPDKWHSRRGLYLAVKHLFRKDVDHILSKEDRTMVWDSFVPYFPYSVKES